MSTALKIIQRACNKLGRGSELISTDQSFLDEALDVLRSRLEFLRKNDVILEETEGGITTTVVTPSELSDEVSEPIAASEDLVNYLAIYLIPAFRTPPESVSLPSASFSFKNLAMLYRVHEIPTKTPSTMLPVGQGGQRRYGPVFFSGQKLNNDAD